MCNPRRVMIHLKRSIEQAWRTTIEETAQRQGQVQELARINADIPLDAEMGDQALLMLERVLQGEFAGFEAWDRADDGTYRRDLGDVVLVYQPGSHQLQIEARLTEMITAEARGSAEASGFTVGEAAVEAVGHYYSDGWGGRTEQRARTEAQDEAQKRLDEAIEALHQQQHVQEIQAAGAAAHAQAEQDAAMQLERTRAEMRLALRERLQMILANAEDRVCRTMNTLVGEAYSQTLIQLVHDNGGRVLSNERTGSVINLELELD